VNESGQPVEKHESLKNSTLTLIHAEKAKYEIKATFVDELII
jgi:hypothetical protein